MNTKEFTIYGDTKIKYKTSLEINQKVVDKIIQWCEKYKQYSGEGLM